MEPTDVTHFADAGLFGGWLAAHHGERDELWVGYWKKATQRPSLTWEESVDEALCFGWIDGLRKRIDEQAYTIRFTPRRAKSIWSSRNLSRYQELHAAARIEPAGVAAFLNRPEEHTGVYSFEQTTAVVLPEVFLARIESDPGAWADWESRPPGYRKQVAYWVMSAKRAVTRERRLASLIEDCAMGRKVKPLR